MKTKTIFKMLAAAMLMPAMLLTTACSNSDDEIINTENIAKKGYTLPVTVNVTRQGDDATTRATYTYNEDTKKGTLAFSAGDKLFVQGFYDEDNLYDFAGVLTWQPGDTFSGTIYLEGPFEGTAEELLSSALGANATLLPAGYGGYGFLGIDNEGTCDASLNLDRTKTFALTKATAVEQFSQESAEEYNNGFALSPERAIVCFTISGLEANKEVAVSFKCNHPWGAEYSWSIDDNVTVDATGVATFAVGMAKYENFTNYSLTVDGNAITLPADKEVEAGKIYNISRSVAPAGPTYPVALSAVTADYLGSVVTTDGNVYATVSDATTAGKTAVAMIAYVGKDAETSTTYNHGLALALGDVSDTKNWCSQSEATCLGTGHQFDSEAGAKGDMAGIDNTDYLIDHAPAGHAHDAASAARGYNSGTHPAGTSAWFLPSAGQWDKMAAAAGSYANLIANAGLQGGDAAYWSSTEGGADFAWLFDSSQGKLGTYGKDYDFQVRACLAF